MNQKNHDDIDELRGNIEGTRQRITGEIEAIGQRLTPEHAREVAKDRMNEAAHAAKGRVTHAADVARHVPGEIPNAVRSNPIPTALMLVGSGWLAWTAVRRARESGRIPYEGEIGYSGYEGRGGYLEEGSQGELSDGAVAYPAESRASRARERFGSFKSSARERAASAKSRAASAKSTARERASAAKSRARERLSQGTSTVKGRANELAGKSKEQVSRVRNRSEDAFSQNPFVFGGLALLTGIGLGMMLPHTQREDRMLGKPRDRVMERAKHIASEAKDVAVHSAKEGVRAARETAKEDGAHSEHLPGGSSSS